MPRKDSANTPASAQAQQEAVSEGIENFELPRALVTRIAKSAVPENVKLQKDTVLSLVKGATVFINYLAATYVHIVLLRRTVRLFDATAPGHTRSRLPNNTKASLRLTCSRPWSSSSLTI
ncbi:hypothetical protein DFH94DRAFT_764025 [Russula ochroleuca]|uniref:DNA polymerase epsilon subunit D n=1 Tax=Russula ochroleuca TaxID=152965 RepID=A0A9P5K1M2_9AGAM|nr:hypothetical protein DFH94DRAFT_764025 [Russula ochroleuca]